MHEPRRRLTLRPPALPHGIGWSVTLALWALAAFAAALVEAPVDGAAPFLVARAAGGVFALAGLLVLFATLERWWVPGAKAPGVIAAALFGLALLVASLRILAAMVLVEFGRVFGGGLGG